MGPQIPDHGRHIRTVFKRDGTTTSEAHGYGGNKCLQAMRPYLLRLGDEVELMPTDELHQPEYTAEQATEREGEPA